MGFLIFIMFMYFFGVLGSVKSGVYGRRIPTPPNSLKRKKTK